MTRTTTRAATIRRQRAMSSALGASLIVVAMPATAQTIVDITAPAIGAVVTSGAVTIAGAPVNVRVDDARAVVNWTTFNVPNGTTANFTNNSAAATAVVLNRVTLPVPTNTTTLGGTINGVNSLIASAAALPQGRGVEVWIANPNGIVMGASGNFNTQGFVATTLDIAPAAFVAGGALRFTSGAAGTFFDNGITGTAGTIATNGGVLALIAPSIDLAGGSFNAGTGPTAFALATDVSIEASFGSPLSLTLNAGTRVATNRIAGTISGDRVYALVTPTAAVDTLLNMPATVTNATVDARGVVVLAGDGLTQNVALAAGADRLSTGPAGATGVGSVTIGAIDMTAVMGTAPTTGLVVLNATDALTTGAIAANGSVSLQAGTSASFTTITGTGTKRIDAADGLISGNAITGGGDIAIGGSGGLTMSGALTASSGNVTIDRDGAVSLGSINASGAVAIGNITVPTTLDVSGAIGAGSLAVTTSGDQSYVGPISVAGGTNLAAAGGSVTAGNIATGIDTAAADRSLTIRSTAIDASLVDAGSTASLTATDGGDVTLGTGLTDGNLTIAAGGTATISGAIDSGGSYAVTGASVVLGTTGTVVTQTAAGAVTIDATAGTVTGRSGLALTSDDDATGDLLAIGGAGTTGLSFASTTLRAGQVGTGILRFRTATASDPFVLGVVTAGTLQQALAAGPVVDSISRTGSIGIDSLALSGVNTIATTGALTVGGAVATGGALTLTGDAGVTIGGALSNLGAGTGAVTISGNVGAAAVSIRGSTLAGALTIDAGTGGASFTTLDGAGAKTIASTGAINGNAINGAGEVALSAGVASPITIGGGIGTLATPVASLTVAQGGAVQLGPVFTAGAASFGQTTALGSLAVVGQTRLGSGLVVDTTGAVSLGAVTADAGSIDIAAGTSFSGSTLDAFGAVGVSAGTSATLTGGSSGAGDFAITAIGAADVAGAVTAGRDYLVTGGTVALGTAGTAVAQSATRAITIIGTGGPGAAGAVTGRAGLTLTSNTADAAGVLLSIGGAQTGNLDFTGTTLRANADGNGEARLVTATPSDGFAFGDVVAGRLSQAGGAPIDRAGAISFGDLTLSGVNAIATDATLTVGAVTVGNGTPALTLTGDAGVTTGALADLAGTTGGIVIAAGAGVVQVPASTLAGALAIDAGVGGVIIGALGGGGDKTIVSAGGITGPGTGGAGATIDGGAVALTAGATGPITVDALGATSPLTSLTIDGGGAVTLGPVVVTVATGIGQTMPVGALTIANVQSGSFASRSAGGTTIGSGSTDTAFGVDAGGLATIAGGLTAGTSYAVAGRDVQLGTGAVLQQAGAGIRVVANGGTISGAAGLVLTSGSGDIILGNAATAGIALGGSTLGAGGLDATTAVRDVTIRTDTPDRALTLGTVLADQLVVGNRSGDITTGALTLGTAGGSNAIATTGTLTVDPGAAPVAIANGGPLALTGGQGVTVRGSITDLASGGPVAITGGTVAIRDTYLASGLTIDAGDGGASFRDLAGAGAKSVVASGAIAGRSIDGAAAVMIVGGSQPVAITDGIGGTVAVTALTIDGGSAVTIGTAGSTARAIDATGDVTIGGTTSPGAFTANGLVRTGGGFAATAIGTIDLDDVEAGGTLVATSTAGDIGFGTLNGPGSKTLSARGAVTGTRIAGAGAVALTAGPTSPIAIASIGAIDAPVASLTINGGSLVTLGAPGSTAANVVVTGATTVGRAPGPVTGALTINGELITGSLASTTTGATTLGRLTTTGAVSIITGTGDLDLGAIATPGSIALQVGGAIRGTTFDAGGSVSLTSGGATTIVGGSSGGDFTVAADGVATISGPVTAGGGYRVRGAGVALGTGIQQANGLVDITATNGPLSGGNGLTLIANADGIGAEAMALDVNGGAIAFGGAALIGGTASDRSDIGILVRSAATPVTLGTVTARALSGVDAARSTFGALSTVGDVSATGPIATQRTLAIGTTGGAITLGTATVSDPGAGITLATTGPTGGAITATSLTAPGAISASARGNATLGTTTAGGAVAITANGINAGRTVAGGTLAMTSGGALTLASGQSGGDASFDAAGTASLGAVNAGGAGITIRALDAAITGVQSAARVNFVNRTPATNAVKLGNGTSAGGFALSQDEVNFVEAGTLTVDGGTGSVEMGTLGFDADAGRSAINILSTGRVDVLGAVTGSGTGRSVRIGGTAADPTAKADVIQLVTTSDGGGRLLLGSANLELRGARIGAGQSAGFLDTIGFDQATGLSVDEVAGSFIGNANSALYNATFGGTFYNPAGAIYLSANSLTVRYTDYALFQNTGVPGLNAGVVLGGATPGNGALVIQGSGSAAANGFALFGTINGIGGTPTALLGPNVIVVTGANIATTRINGCLVGSGAGCLTSVVVQPVLNIFDSSRLDVFRIADDLAVPFDPVIGTNNEALFSGITLLDVPISDTECAEGVSTPECAQSRGERK